MLKGGKQAKQVKLFVFGLGGKRCNIQFRFRHQKTLVRANLQVYKIVVVSGYVQGRIGFYSASSAPTSSMSMRMGPQPSLLIQIVSYHTRFKRGRSPQ